MNLSMEEIKHQNTAQDTYIRWKGILERLLALLALSITLPVSLMVALAVMIDSPGGPIFSQERVGKGGRKFTIYKFRTMHKTKDDSNYRKFLEKYVRENASSRLDENGRDVFQLIRDPRVTRVGSFLRKTGLDELPQLLNVLKSDMSFIGPRPDLPFAVSMYKGHHRDRLAAKPGITGLWQVSGRRNLSFDDAVRLDVDYIKNQSPQLDARILLLTVREVLTRDGR